MVLINSVCRNSKKQEGRNMLASSNVVTLLAEQNSETDKSRKCLAEQEIKTDESEKNCAPDEAGRRKKRLDWETHPDLKSELNKYDKEQEEVIGAGSLLTGEEIHGETEGLDQKIGGSPSIEPGLQVGEPCPGKIGRRKGKKDRKVGS